MLLTGGASSRFGAPKHRQPHPGGGSWASHLIDLFRQVFGPGPVRILGEPVAERPELPCLDDPREGPARALAGWAAAERARAERWWVVACDQVRWNEASLIAWHAAARRVDPQGRAWILAEFGGELQPLGGFLGGCLLDLLGGSRERRLMALVRALPHRTLPWAESPFQDLDDPESFQAWLEERRTT